MFETISQTIPADPDELPRSRRLGLYRRVIDGTLYDFLPYAFSEERNGAGEYVPLRARRPSVRYGLCRIVVEDSVALLFSAGHFPLVVADDPAVTTLLADIIRETRLNSVMIDAAMRGAVGSVAVLMRVLRGRLFYSVLESRYLTPEWRAEAPDTLARVTERYKVRGDSLIARGYGDIDPRATYWFKRVWDSESEIWYRPKPVLVPDLPDEVDVLRTVRHGLGIVPIAWIRNLPGGDEIDGACTFRAAIESSIEIDYQLSQVGRGLKYASDPTLLIKEPAMPEGPVVKGAGNALVVSEKGDARLLEIGGTAAGAVIDYVRTLREFALESVHGNRANADRLSAAQSGRALELMNQGLIWLADNLRISYGDGGLLVLLRMALKARERFPIMVRGAPMPLCDSDTRLTLRWPRWYPLSADDRLKDAQATATLIRAGQLSRATALGGIAGDQAIADIEAELERIDSEKQDHA